MTEDRAELMYYLGKAFPKLGWIGLVLLAAYGEGLYAAEAAQAVQHMEEQKIAV